MDNIHIFDNISDQELEKMMVCFKSQIRTFRLMNSFYRLPHLQIRLASSFPGKPT